MPPARSDIATLVRGYLARHPAEQRELEPLLSALNGDADPTSRSTLPAHVTCSAVIVDRDRHVLHIQHRASGGLMLTPGGHIEPGDRSLLAAVLREVTEETGIQAGDLCLTDAFLDSPIDINIHTVGASPGPDEPGHRHYDLRFVFYLADEQRPSLVLQDEEVSGAQWMPFDQVPSLTLRTKLLAAPLTGRPEPVNASALIHDGAGRYLLHLRDHLPGVIWEPGAFSVLGGGREEGDTSLEDTLRRELGEEVPGLHIPVLEPFAVEWATSIEGLKVPIQIFAGQWTGDPHQLALHEGVLLHWFEPGELHRLRLSPATHQLILSHASHHTHRAPARHNAANPSKQTVLNGVGGHLYLEDEQGRVLLGLRHPDSAFAPNQWHFPAGHCEHEPVLGCVVREAAEELGIKIDPSDAEFVHVVHLIDEPGDPVPKMEMVFRTRRWTGSPRLLEPDRCVQWRWWNPKELPDDVVPYTRQAIEGICAGRLYSDMGW